MFRVVLEIIIAQEKLAMQEKLAKIFTNSVNKAVGKGGKLLKSQSWNGLANYWARQAISQQWAVQPTG